MSDAWPTIQPPLAAAAQRGAGGRGPLSTRPPNAPRQRLTLVVTALAAAATLIVTAHAAREIRSPTVWIEPFALPVETVDVAPEQYAGRLAAATRALAARARDVDELGGPSGSGMAPLRVEVAYGALANATRIVRRLLGTADAHIVGELTFTPDHADALVRDVTTHGTVRSRVVRGPRAIDRLIAPAAEDVLLLVAPHDVAALALADAPTLADTARLDEIITMLARHPSSADDPRTLAVRGAYEAVQGRCREALALFDRVIAAHPTAARPYVFAADCHARLGDRDRALELLALAAEHARERPRALTLAGDAYRRIGEPVRALELLRVARQRDPQLPKSAIAIGETLIALHRPREALAWLSEHPVEGPWRARWLGALGLAQVRSGQGPAAEATVAALRGLDPGSLGALRIEAELATAMKAWPQALARYNALRIGAPGDASARAGEGRALIGLQRPADAVDAYRACIDVAPWLAECRLGLGIALREADRAEEALAPLAEAARLDASDPRIAHETARTLRALLRRDEAAVESARGDALARRLLQKLALP